MNNLVALDSLDPFTRILMQIRVLAVLRLLPRSVLERLAKNHKPPQSWYDAEEDLFGDVQ